MSLGSPVVPEETKARLVSGGHVYHVTFIHMRATHVESVKTSHDKKRLVIGGWGMQTALQTSGIFWYQSRAMHLQNHGGYLLENPSLPLGKSTSGRPTLSYVVLDIHWFTSDGGGTVESYSRLDTGTGFHPQTIPHRGLSSSSWPTRTSKTRPRQFGRGVVRYQTSYQ